MWPDQQLRREIKREWTRNTSLEDGTKRFLDAVDIGTNQAHMCMYMSQISDISALNMNVWSFIKGEMFSSIIWVRWYRGILSQHRPRSSTRLEKSGIMFLQWKKPIFGRTVNISSDKNTKRYPHIYWRDKIFCEKTFLISGQWFLRFFNFTLKKWVYIYTNPILSH